VDGRLDLGKDKVTATATDKDKDQDPDSDRDKDRVGKALKAKDMADGDASEGILLSCCY
jgi:hypothetical protein